MAEINNSLAAQVSAGQPAQPLDLTKTLGAISQIDLARAHAGLYGLQAQQEARKLQGFDYLKGNPSDYLGAIQRGLDPAVGSTLQGMSEKERAYKATPGGLAPESYEQLSSAGEKQAGTRKLNVETGEKHLDVQGRIAAMIAADPSDAGVERAHQAARAAGVDTNPLVYNQFLKMSPEQRVQVARSKIAGGMPPAELTSPHNVPPTDTVTSRGGMLSVPPSAAQPPAPAPQFGTVPPPVSLEQKTEIEAKGEYTKQSLEASGKSYTAATSLLQRIPVIAHDIETLGPAWMGTGAEAKTAFAKGWNSTVDTVSAITGVKPNAKMMFDPSKIATSEELYKEQIRAGMELINSNFGGSREAASIIQMGRAAVSGQGNTPLGAKFVLSTIEAAARRQADLHEFKLENPGLLSTAEIRFNRQHPPETYGFNALAGAMPPGSIDYLRKNPGTAKQFDSTFHVPGMAKYILSQKAQQ